uniref:BED-type domain-containing protein n=1 Tax=Solanum lycopersicum TaxID=4081 RepID=A0A3Q7GIN0_SOLLC
MRNSQGSHSQSVTQASGEVQGHKSPVFGECTIAENIIIDKVIGETGDSNSNAIDQSQTIESKLKKGRKKRSRVWDHFTHKTDIDRSEKVVCNYCKKEYFAVTKEHGTTSMLTHINKCIKMPYNVDIKQ